MKEPMRGVLRHFVPAAAGGFSEGTRSYQVRQRRTTRIGSRVAIRCSRRVGHGRIRPNTREDVRELRSRAPDLAECFVGKRAYMDHPAYVACMCLARTRGPAAAQSLAQRFIDEIRIERWLRDS